jgi:BASS family bile acid:Na+ symporter
MTTRAKQPAFAERMSRPLNAVSLLFLALIILLAVLKEDNLGAQFREAGPVTLLLNLLTMGLGFGIAALAGLLPSVLAYRTSVARNLKPLG